MALPSQPQALAPFAIMAAAMAFAVYRRMRQHIGQQPLRPTRMKVRMGLLSVVAVIVIGTAFTLANLGAAVAGAVGGVALALYGLHLTRIERTPEGVFYTGNIYIGLALTLLLVGRIGYRFVAAAGTIQSAAAHQGGAIPPQNAFASSVASPLTVGLLLVMVGYYVCYYAGLLLKTRRLSD